MNIQLTLIKPILAGFRILLRKVQRYSVLIFILGMVVLYSFLIFSIGQASQTEPTEEAVAEQLKTVKRLKIDQQSIDKIQQLKDQSVSVKSLFESARDNPFQE